MSKPAHPVSRFFCLASLLGVIGPEVAHGWQDNVRQSDGSRFIRLAGPAENPTALETSVARYVNPKRPGVSVDLVGAVHIGEGDYYATLNELFKGYDVVLYELVAEEGTRVPQGGARKSGNPIAFLQSTARNFLGLESQLERVDYSPRNLRHADLSPADLAEKMRERGDSGWSLALGAMTEMMQRAESGESGGLPNSMAGMDNMMDLLSDPLQAKRFMARQFGDPAMLELGLGQKLSQLIVNDRNEAAVEVLDEEIEDGSKRIAIFYGAAHMPDFQQRLADRGFRYSGHSWLAAWDLTQSNAKNDHPMSLLMQLMKELDQ